MSVKGKTQTKYGYEFLRDLARTYDVRDRRFFNAAELQEEVDLIESTLPKAQMEEAHAKATLHVDHIQRLKREVSRRMRARGYDTNRARNERRGMRSVDSSLEN